VSAHTFAHNRIYGRPIVPLGQTYQNPSAAEMQRFRQVWAGYGSAGLSWWDWQETGAAEWGVLGSPAPIATPLADPGWPTLGKGAKGDEVVWMQQHLASAVPGIDIDGTLDTATATALKTFQTTNGIPPTGTTDPVTWQALLHQAVTPVDWAGGGGTQQVRVLGAARRLPAPDSATLPAKKTEVPEVGRGG
jgi:hypothetical protein